MMDVLCALVLCASVRLAAGMAPLMGSFVPVGRLQGPEEVRMLLQSAAETRGEAIPQKTGIVSRDSCRGIDSFTYKYRGYRIL